MKKNNMRFWKRTRGFSLIEIMVTISIAVLLMTIAMPSMRQLVVQSQDQILQDQLLHLLSFARRAALLQQQTVGVCPSQDLMTCSMKPAAGVIILIDKKNNSEVIYTFRFKQNGKIHWRGFPQGFYLQFLATGMTAQENGSFWYSEGNGLPAWRITVNKAGQSRIETVTNRY